MRSCSSSAGEVLGVLALGGDALRLRRGAAAELDLEPRAREDGGGGGAHRPGADHQRRAQRRQAAEPLPLELDAGPDARRDLLRERRRGLVHARVGERGAAADVTRTGRISQPRRACSVPVTAIGTTGAPLWSARRPTPRLGLRERAAADARALGEDHDRLAALEQRERGGHRLVVGLAAPDREGAHAVEEPADQRVLEQLALGDEVDRAAEAAADHERVEEAAVVGREDHAAVRDVGAAAAPQPEVDLDRRLEDEARRPVDVAVHAATARALVVELKRARAGAGGGRGIERQIPDFVATVTLWQWSFDAA